MPPKRKGKKEKEVVAMTAEEIDLMEEHVNELLKSQLPIGRVKKICRLDPDVEMINSEATILMTKAAELFIAELGKAANINAAHERRKTVQQKDIDKCIKKLWTFAFLEDALDGWPKNEPKKRKKPEESGEATLPIESQGEGNSQEAEMDETCQDGEEAENVEEEEDDPDDEVVEESQKSIVENLEEGKEKDDEAVMDEVYVDKFSEQF